MITKIKKKKVFIVPLEMKRKKLIGWLKEGTVDWPFTLCCKCLGSFAVLWCKMPMFLRAGMREGEKSLPLAFQYLIFMVKRPCDLNLVIIPSLATKCQHFKLRGLQFHYIKGLKKGHFKFEVLAFWSQWRYHYQIQITRPLYHENQILKS